MLRKKNKELFTLTLCYFTIVILIVTAIIITNNLENNLNKTKNHVKTQRLKFERPHTCTVGSMGGIFYRWQT